MRRLLVLAVVAVLAPAAYADDCGSACRPTADDLRSYSQTAGSDMADMGTLALLAGLAFPAVEWTQPQFQPSKTICVIPWGEATRRRFEWGWSYFPCIWAGDHWALEVWIKGEFVGSG